MIEALRKVIKRMHYPLEVMLTCVRWYVAYPLSLRHIEEMMVEAKAGLQVRLTAIVYNLRRSWRLFSVAVG
jgi:transposase-like protein